LSIWILIISLISACASPPISQDLPAPAAQTEAAPTGLEPPPLLAHAANSGLLYPLDPANGETLPGYEPLPTGGAHASASSAGGSQLAFISGSGQLTLIDLPGWDYQSYQLELPRPAFQLVFSPDGRRLAIAAGNRESSLAIFDLDQEQLVGTAGLEFTIHQMKFTADGAGLMAYGTHIENRFTVNESSSGPPGIALLDASSLELLWSQSLPGLQHGIVPKEGADPDADLHQPGQALYLLPGLAWAPDRDALYLAHAGQELLSVVDFSARQVTRLEIHDRLSWLERLLSLGAGRARAKVAEGTALEAALSPDGSRLYLLGSSSSLVDPQGGDWEVVHTPLGLQVIDPVSGERLAWYETNASSLSISPDGTRLYLRAWGQDEPWTEVFDLASGESVARLQGVYAQPVRGLDGRWLLASSQPLSGDRWRVILVDPHAFENIWEWESQGYLTWISS
jgi:hypothetical protein